MCDLNCKAKAKTSPNIGRNVESTCQLLIEPYLSFAQFHILILLSMVSTLAVEDTTSNRKPFRKQIKT